MLRVGKTLEERHTLLLDHASGSSDQKPLDTSREKVQAQAAIARQDSISSGADDDTPPSSPCERFASAVVTLLRYIPLVRLMMPAPTQAPTEDSAQNLVKLTEDLGEEKTTALKKEDTGDTVATEPFNAEEELGDKQHDGDLQKPALRRENAKTRDDITLANDQQSTLDDRIMAEFFPDADHGTDAINFVRAFGRLLVETQRTEDVSIELIRQYLFVQPQGEKLVAANRLTSALRELERVQTRKTNPVEGDEALNEVAKRVLLRNHLVSKKDLA